MKKKIVFVAFVLISLSSYAQYVVQGGQKQPLRLDASTYNINVVMQVYALYGLNGAEISYTSSDAVTHQWYKYTRDINDAVEVDFRQTGNTSYITTVESNCGYYVNQTGQASYPAVWIIDYSQYVPSFSMINPDMSAEDQCNMLKLKTDMTAPSIFYYLPNGDRAEIVRRFSLEYNTLDWREDLFAFQQKDTIQTIKGASNIIVLQKTPLCDTDFTLSGDEIATYFGVGEKTTSDLYQAVRVEAHCKFDDGDIDTPDNQQIITGDMTYSAPVDFVFTGTANDPVAAFYQWRIYRTDQGKTEAVVNFTGSVLRYTFTDAGKYKVQFDVGDRQSVCADSVSIDVTITESFLDAPNAFSPASSPGVNDIYKVSYKSIVKFNAWIFNRWGNQLYHWSDPADGWDGKVNGKIVPTGVYYVVIEAEGSDGKKYKIRRDVNILR